MVGGDRQKNGQKIGQTVDGQKIRWVETGRDGHRIGQTVR